MYKQPVIPAQQRPNLLFVFTDEHSWDILGCYGNSFIQTPRIDAFARQGTRFNQCISNSPVCSPYRSMLMSGQHPLYNGMVDNDYPLLADNGKNLGEVLRDAGYRVGYIGKWHLLGGDRDRPIPRGRMRYGFDETFYTNNCHVNYAPGECFFWNESGEKEFFSVWEPEGQTLQALEFLNAAAEDPRPWALFISWHPPHDIGLQEPSCIYRYDTLPELMEVYDSAAIPLRPNTEDTPEIRHAYHGHMAMITGLDALFGRVLDRVATLGAEENTLAIFTSDHGDNLHAWGTMDAKTAPYDESVRVPMIMRWPGRITAGAATDLLFGTLDIMPTLLGLLDLPIPETCQGENLAEEVFIGSRGERQSLPLFFLIPGWRGVYTRDHTYAIGRAPHRVRRGGQYEAITRSVDVLLHRDAETGRQDRNTYGHRETRDLQARLHFLMLEWMESFGDRLDAEAVLAPIYRRWRDEETLPHSALEGPRPIDVLRAQVADSTTRRY